MFKYVLFLLIFVLGVDSNAAALQRHCSTVNGKEVCVYLDEKENSVLNKIRKRNNSNYRNNNNANLTPKVNTEVYNNSYGAGSKVKSKSSYSSADYKRAKKRLIVYIVPILFIVVYIWLIVIACKKICNVFSGND